MRALVTGIVGFAGSHLAAELLDSGYELFGTRLPGESRNRLRESGGSVSLSAVDLTDSAATIRLIRRVKPDIVFHLAAIAAVRYSFANPRQTFEVNVNGTVNLLEALRKIGSARSIVTVTSSDIYGIVKPSDLPIKETVPLQPVTPYGVSKAAVDMLAYQYFKSYQLPIIRARAFNHAGPRQTAGFVVTDFCRQAAMIEAEQARPVMKVGNLDAKRDISDVRDIVRGYRLLAEKGKPGDVYNLCSGKSHRIKWILDYILNLISLDVSVMPDPELSRPSEIPNLIGDFAKARRAVGYRPGSNLEGTLQDTLSYWRKAVRRNRN
jgi:GDP-4-dehydro-6-deoxy-D-mannose reductase